MDMRLALVTAALLLGQPVSLGKAADRTATCRIVVRGHTYLDGPCLFSPSADGSFSVGTGTATVPRSPHFAYVSKTGPDAAEAFWNKDEGDTHADDPLGTVRRSGACWTNPTATICAQ